jgi:cobalt/nickel transport system permease protein
MTGRDALVEHALADSPIHRLGAGVKTITALVFIVAVVSFSKYEVWSLLPLFCFPLMLIVLGDVPLKPLLLRMLLVSPFAIFAGMFNPFIDIIELPFAGYLVAGGWLSFLSILLRFSLTVSVALATVATTPFEKICKFLDSVKVPRVLVVQLLMLYRYLNVLIEEGGRIMLARRLRAPVSPKITIKTATSMLGVLFVRTLDRAERVYQAMLLRGFDGRLPLATGDRVTWADAAFLVICISGITALRLLPVVEWFGSTIGERL